MTITRPIPEPPLPLWEDEFYDTKLEAELKASIDQARKTHLPRDLPPAPRPMLCTPTVSASETLDASTLAGLISGCGVAVIDGYLHMKEYAAAKGLDLAEFDQKGINFQDLLSTAIIHTQRLAEMEIREAGARRYKR